MPTCTHSLVVRQGYLGSKLAGSPTRASFARSRPRSMTHLAAGRESSRSSLDHEMASQHPGRSPPPPFNTRCRRHRVRPERSRNMTRCTATVRRRQSGCQRLDGWAVVWGVGVGGGGGRRRSSLPAALGASAVPGKHVQKARPRGPSCLHTSECPSSKSSKSSKSSTGTRQHAVASKSPTTRLGAPDR